MFYKVGSLFAGVGGICLGFKRASDRFKLIFANEIDDKACITYSRNFAHKLIKGDIEKILEPNLLKKEKEFLEIRMKELLQKNKEIMEFNFDEKVIKDSIKKLDKSFISDLIREKFELTDSIRKNIKKRGYIEDNFKILIELKLIQLILERDYNSFIFEKKYTEYCNKKKEILETSIDILTAGFPCQSFSIAGERKGFLDHRGELFYSIINLIEKMNKKGLGKPRVIFLENVKNLVTHNKGETFKIIKRELENLGYIIKYKVLNTYRYTFLPQNRERIFIIGFLNKEDAEAFGSLGDLKELNRKEQELEKTLAKVIDYTIKKENRPELYYTKEKYPNYFLDDGINIEKEINEMYKVYQIRRGMYIRKNQSGVCPTLTANMGTGGHNVPLIKTYDGIRKLSPEDCFNLQGFKVGKEYVLPMNIGNNYLYMQSGNAVSVDIIELLAKKILDSLEKVDNNKKKLKEAYIK